MATTRATPARLDDLPRAAGTTAVALTDYLGRLGGFAESIEVGERVHKRTVEVGLERGVGTYVLGNLAYAKACYGQTDAAIAVARKGRATMRRDNLPWQSYFSRTELVALVWSGRIEEANALATASSPLRESVADDEEEQISWTAILVLLELANTRDSSPSQRTQSVKRMSEQALAATKAEDSLQVLALVGALGLVLAEVRTLGLDGADELLAGIVRHLSALPDEPWAAAARHFVAACAGPREDVQGWTRAAEHARDGALPVVYAHEANRRLALAHAARGEKVLAIELLGAVVDAARVEGSGLVSTWARGDLIALGAAPASGEFAGLTPRELEVLGLVTDGLSNGEIGKRLFISTKTASVHVSAILAKLGASNRTEAAAIYSRTRES